MHSPATATTPIELLGIPGSVRVESLNVRLLQAAGAQAGEEADLELLVQPELARIPPFDPDAEVPVPAERLRGAVAEADALLFATPEYNGSIPGTLKNLIDWVSAPQRLGPLRGKAAAVIGVDRGEAGCDWAHADARKVLEVAGARVVSAGLSLSAEEVSFDDANELADGEQRRQLDAVLEELISEGRLP